MRKSKVDSEVFVISAVVVCYNPDNNVLELVDTLLSQVDWVIVVDNSDTVSSDICIKLSQLENERFIYLGTEENQGIAKAQNCGFDKARELNSNYIFTFDQDSSIKESYVNNMMLELFSASEKYNNIAILGPKILNERSGCKEGEIKVDNIEEKKSIISSGSLISMSAIDEIGENLSSWFIDLVDIEWCFRARKRGWLVLQTNKVTLLHNLGEFDKQLPIIGLQYYSKPFRLKYFSRNTIFCLSSSSFSSKEKVFRLFILLLEVYKSIFVSDRMERLLFIYTGIKLGIKNIGGKIDV
nr:glycosyltransferase [Vibrio parahaemolyticus]